MIERPSHAPRQHDWLAPGEHPNHSKWTCCRACGRVRCEDGKPDSECPGVVHVALREGTEDATVVIA